MAGKGMCSLSNNFIKPSLQFNLGYKHKYYEIALSNKFGMVNLSNIRYTPGDSTQKPWESLQNAMDEPRRFVYEPGLMFRAGIPELRFQFYLGLSPILGSDWPNDAMIVSIGLSSTFGRQKSRGMNW